MDGVSTLPIASRLPDQLSEGIGAAGAGTAAASAPHPVALIEARCARQQDANRMALLSRLYGAHLPMKLHMEQTVLSQFRRPAGLPSSSLGLSIVMGMDEDIDFGDVHNRPENQEAHYDPLSEMEHRMNPAQPKRRVF